MSPTSYQAALPRDLEFILSGCLRESSDRLTVIIGLGDYIWTGNRVRELCISATLKVSA